MINKFSIGNLQNAEYFQFISSACDPFAKYDIDRENLGVLYDDLNEQLKTAEFALAIEKKNEKIRQKNDMDRYRDRLHSKFFNYLKFILYDEKDSRFDDPLHEIIDYWWYDRMLWSYDFTDLEVMKKLKALYR